MRYACLKRCLLQGFRFRGKVVVVPFVRTARTIVAIQQTCHKRRIIGIGDQRLPVNTVAYQAILATHAAAANGVDFKSKGRTTARIIVDFRR